MATPATFTPASEYEENDLLRGQRYQQSQGMHQYGQDPNTSYKEPRGCVPASKTKRRWLFIGVPIALLIIAGVVVGVVVGVTRHKSSSSSSSGGSGSGSNNSTTSTVAANGTTGSTITLSSGKNFTYTNTFGGSWAVDPNDPYSVSGQAQSWSPSINDEWVWGEHIIRGVNLGGWLVTEPFIVPSLYEAYQNATPQPVDEYTLSEALGDNLETVLTEHYETFITEQDFADIAAAGLNWVRIPLGFWAIETIDGEPYLQGVSWTYFLKAIEWGRKYGIRILLDLHALPGSQNGWNHSGKVGVVNWMYGVMGLANGQRTLEILRSLTEFISQEGIKEVVPMIGLVNEVQAVVVGNTVLESFYYQAYQLIRGITGYGSGNGPIIALHEGFRGIAAWTSFMGGADRVAIDQHPYLAFTGANTNSFTSNTKQACGWGGGTNDSSTAFGITIGGEWSLATNDCGKWLNGVGSNSSFENAGDANCTDWEDYANYSDERKEGLLGYVQAQMDALQNYFFWTWKIGNSTEFGYPTSSQWHYKLGLEQGWIPKDPRVAGGYCARVQSVGGDYFSGTYPASATGGVTTSQAINATQVSSIGVWPPTSMGPSYTASQISLFPTLTQTGTPVTLATGSHAASATAVGNGWESSNDTAKAWVRVNGCDYPNEYNATATSNLPTALCTGTVAKRALISRITPAPVS